MTITELIEEILNEWAYRVENGMPDPKNPIHVKELGIVLSGMGLSHIKNDLVENLLIEKGKTPEKHVVEADKAFSNPILSKKVSYKDKDGNAKDGIVGNLLRLPKDSPGRVAAEKLLPPEGSPERDSMNQDLGGEGQPKKPEDEKGKEGGAEEAPKEDPAKAAAAMFDPKADPAMAARMDREKDANAQLAKDAEADKEVEKEQEPKKEDEFNPIDSKDVAKEMPQADPETFNGDSDIPDGIEPEDLEKFNTDISKVQQIVADAKAKGEKAPDINLCDITVPGTNLYCDDNLGIPRDQMPQFKGKPQPGTPAADMEVDEKGEVDTEPLFKKMLEEKGIKVVQTEIPSDKLKATQKDLVGAKVVGMMGALEENPEHPSITAPIYVSRDGYVIDGHHRWAAIAAYNAKNPDKQIPMKVQVIDQDIKDAIPMCNKFAEEQGVAAKKADANKEGPSEQPNAAKEKTKEETTKVASELKGRTTTNGEELDVDTTDNGSLIIGVEHGADKESNKQAIEQIKKLPKDTKVMFVGEGGSKDDDGNIEFGGEQDEFRNEVKGHFDNAEESTWDENADVLDDKAPVYDEVANVVGGSKSKAKAAVWSNMYGQDGPDENMLPEDYLDDEGKAWLIDQAQKGGVTSITKDTDFNNLSDEQKDDLYQLNYRDDDGYGETEISKAQEAYNGFRQKELDRKIKEAEDNGYTVIAPVGNSHVDMRRQRNKKAGATSTPSSTTTTSTAKPSTPSTTSTPTSAPKLTDKVKQKISNWTEKEKAFFERNEGAPGSKERRSLGQALKDKAAGALKAIKKGAKHEVEEFKAAGSGIKNFFSGKPLSEHEQKAVKAVAFKVVTTAVFGAAFGGLSHGVAAFGKHVAMEFIPHIIGETLLKGVGKAAVFADADGEAETDANVLKFTEMIAKGLEEMEITPEMMEQMVDSYNEKKENGEVENETPEVKAEHLHLVDELMLEMIYGFIEEATATTKDWKLAARIGGPDGKIVYFGSKERKDAALNAGTHFDVDKKLNAKAEQPKNEPVAGADLFKGDYEKERGTGKKKGGGSFKDSYLNNSKAGKPEKAQEDFEKRRQKALSQIDKAAEYNSDTPGVFRLETEEGSGKFIEIKTEDVKIAINKLFNGEKLSANDKKNLNLTTKIVTNPENGDVKLYFAKKIAGRQPQQGYESVLMAEKNIPMGDAFREYAIENGLKVGKSGEGAFGKKQVNPNKVAKGGNPKEPIKNLKVKSDKNGIEVNGQRFNYKPIPTKSELNKLREKLLKKGLSSKEADERIRILVNTRKKENQVLATIAEVASKSGGEIPYCNFGDVFTPEGRKATITNVITGVTKMFTDGLNNHQNTFNTENLLEKPENKKVFDTLKRLEKISKSSNLETDKEAQLAFKKELDQLLIDMAESVDFKDSVADFAEMVVGLGSLAGGKRVMFPSSENFQTADIIILPSGESISDADLVNVSIEELDLTGGVSIKSDGGGGSALKNRIELTEYKNPKTKGKLLNALNTYQTAYGNQQDVKEEELVKGEAIIEDLFKHGIEMGCFTKQDIQKIKKIGEKQGQSEIKTAGDAGNCGGKENQKRLHRAMILQHQQMQLTCIISNCDTDWTGYSNVNKKYSKKKGKVVKVTDDIADGVKKPCYSNPHHNPGYTKSVDKNGCVSLTPSNQNPAHIVSKIPDLINNFKE
jgi:hypothetical protein